MRFNGCPIELTGVLTGALTGALIVELTGVLTGALEGALTGAQTGALVSVWPKCGSFLNKFGRFYIISLE